MDKLQRLIFCNMDTKATLMKMMNSLSSLLSYPGNLTMKNSMPPLLGAVSKFLLNEPFYKWMQVKLSVNYSYIK